MTTPSDSPQERPTTASRRLAHAGLAFDSAMLEAQFEREPENLEVLAALAETCTRLRRYRRGLELDTLLVARQPEQPTFRYNLACSLALLGRLEEAQAQLLAAVEHGYRDFDHLQRDPDLRRLRAAPGYAAFRERLQILGLSRREPPPPS